MPLKLALGVRDTVAGHRLGALHWGAPPPFSSILPPPRNPPPSPELQWTAGPALPHGSVRSKSGQGVLNHGSQQLQRRLLHGIAAVDASDVALPRRVPGGRGAERGRAVVLGVDVRNAELVKYRAEHCVDGVDVPGQARQRQAAEVLRQRPLPQGGQRSEHHATVQGLPEHHVQTGQGMRSGRGLQKGPHRSTGVAVWGRICFTPERGGGVSGTQNSKGLCTKHSPNQCFLL